MSSIDDLRKLRTRVQVLPHSQACLSLGFRQLSSAQKKEWEGLLERDLSACGCQEGAAFLLVALVGFLLFLLAGFLGVTALTWRLVILGAGAVFMSGLAGKVAGLVMAQIRLRHHLTMLERVLQRAEHGLTPHTS